MLDAQRFVFPSTNQDEPALDRLHLHQFTWTFRYIIFAVEALAIYATGVLLQKMTLTQFEFVQPLDQSFFYYFLVILMDGVTIPPFKRQSHIGVRAVAAVFLCSFGLHASLALTSVWGSAALAIWFIGSAAGVTILRNGGMDIMQRFPVTWPLPPHAIVFGNGAWATDFARHNRLAGARAAFNVVGIVDDPNEAKLPHQGTNALAARIVAERVTDVFVALPSSATARIEDVLAALRFLPVTIRLAPVHLSPLRIAGVDVEAVASMPVLSRPSFSKIELSIKRVLDVVGALTLLLLLLPLFGTLSILIKLDSPGPVLFRQTRIGQFGRGFSIYKFRSLHVAQADDNAEQLVSRGDSRVTRIGRYARRYSLDELPQLLNVVLGSMSLVGPRPHAHRAKADGKLYAEVWANYPLRYRVKPGMTGWAQVNGWRGNTDTAEKLLKRVEFDFDYIRRWSLALDFQILLRTIPSVFVPPADNA